MWRIDCYTQALRRLRALTYDMSSHVLIVSRKTGWRRFTGSLCVVRLYGQLAFLNDVIVLLHMCSKTHKAVGSHALSSFAAGDERLCPSRCWTSYTLHKHAQNF